MSTKIVSAMVVAEVRSERLRSYMCPLMIGRAPRLQSREGRADGAHEDAPRAGADRSGALEPNHVYIYIYIYICMRREREREIHIYIYIYISFNTYV